MLSDEEKKAVEMLDKYITEHKMFNIKQADDLEDNIRILLKLIRKQSKEIEHQKEKRENQKKELAILNTKQIEVNKLVNTVNSYKGQFKRQQKEIEELKDESKEYQIGFAQGCYEKDLDWKDKIKAKIEEVHYKMIGHQDLREAVKQALQSLLEKE